MIKNVQVLRAVAAMAVVYFHLPGMATASGFPVLGASGVDLFFVISGFVMVHTTKSNPPSGWTFMRSRVARIVPLYWLLTFGVFGLAIAAPTLLQATRPDALELVKSLAFVPFEKSNGNVQPVLFLGWTLNYEMFFYVLFAFGLGLRRYKWGLMTVGAVLIALTGIGATVHPVDVLGAFYTRQVVCEFALGMLIGYLAGRAPRDVSTGTKLAVSLGLLGLPIAMAAPLILPTAPQLLVCGLPSAALVLSAILLERWGWAVSISALLVVGDASYAMYLCHPYITTPLGRMAARLSLDGPAAALALAASLAAVAVVSVLIHKTVERPLSRWAKALLVGAPSPFREVVIPRIDLSTHGRS